MLPLSTYVIAYLAAALTFLIVDFLWLGLAMKRFYRRHLGALMADRINPWVAGLFYLGFVVGLMVFAVAPALAAGDAVRAATDGALFGLFTYGTYNLTNWATLRDWSPVLSIVDLGWGAMLSGLCALVGYAAAHWLTG